MYNEERRLNSDLIIKSLGITDIVAIDDGSSDGTLKRLKELSHLSGFKILSSKNNLGKGNVLQWAFQELLKEIDLSQYEWIGYWDADFSAPIDELLLMIDYSKNIQNCQVVWASRMEKNNAKINRRWVRFVLGRLFNLVSSFLLRHKLYDSQCGAKIFSSAAAKIAFSNPFISRWLFDLEIFLRLMQTGAISVHEYPISKWSHVKGSKVSLLWDGGKVLIDLVKIRFKYIK